MKVIISCLFFLFRFTAFSQNNFSIKQLPLPAELASPDNQFSGLYISGGKLFFLSESRLQDKAEAKLYVILLTDVDRKIADSGYVLPYKKFHIYLLDLLQQKMKEKGDDYEGLEAVVIDGNDIFFSVETATPSANSYLVKGHLNASNIVMDPEAMVTLKKPVNSNRSHIYNAGFEAVSLNRGNIYSFFEYNYFPQGNYTQMIPASLFERSNALHTVFTDRIPFRVTDITSAGEDRFTAINYFYKGGGDDAVYRVPLKDGSANRLITDSTGKYRSYCRLIDIKLDGSFFTWRTSWELPEKYWGYNWEGIAAYKEGFFLINDKYTPAKPYSSTLIYLKKEP